MEKSFKENCKKHEEEVKTELLKEITSLTNNLETTILEKENLKIDVKNLKIELEQGQNLLNEKTEEFKKLIDNKDKHNEKLMKSLKDIQKETRLIESNCQNKINEWQTKFKQLEENEKKSKT